MTAIKRFVLGEHKSHSSFFAPAPHRWWEGHRLMLWIRGLDPHAFLGRITR
jgi:hypothetical protein